MLSIGQQLAQARKARGLSPEDVAFHTRIPVSRVRDLENDDLSRFGNLTYAKGFLKLYSRYLDVDISGYLEEFSTSDFAQAASREYVQTANATQNLPQAVFTDYARARRPGLYVLVAAVLAIGGFFIWRSQHDQSEQESDAASRQVAKEETRPAQPPTEVPPPPAPEPAPAVPPPAVAENAAPAPPAAETIPAPPAADIPPQPPAIEKPPEPAADAPEINKTNPPKAEPVPEEDATPADGN